MVLVLVSFWSYGVIFVAVNIKQTHIKITIIYDDAHVLKLMHWAKMWGKHKSIFFFSAILFCFGFLYNSCFFYFGKSLFHYFAGYLEGNFGWELACTGTYLTASVTAQLRLWKLGRREKKGGERKRKWLIKETGGGKHSLRSRFLCQRENGSECVNSRGDWDVWIRILVCGRRERVREYEIDM